MNSLDVMLYKTIRAKFSTTNVFIQTLLAIFHLSFSAVYTYTLNKNDAII